MSRASFKKSKTSKATALTLSAFFVHDDLYHKHSHHPVTFTHHALLVIVLTYSQLLNWQTIKSC